MEAWMEQPGAHVVGHRAVVRGGETGCDATCGCGFSSTPSSLAGACLALAGHLAAAVRAGAQVAPGGDGLAGVREPRRPRPPHGSGSVALDV